MKTILDNIKTKISNLLRQGLSPKQLIESIIVTVVLAVIPILGVSTFMITTVSLKRKLNLPLMISLSYLLWPIQILLIIPFIRVGEFIFSIPQNQHTVDEIINSFQNSFFQTLSQLSFELLCGVGGWTLTAIPIAMLMYWFSLLFLRGN